MKNLMLTFAILFLFTLYLSADTYIPGGDVSGTWELTGSPFYIEGEINIPTSETLTIEPGVEVIFNGHYKFIVNGFIEAIGTETDSILFTSADPVIGWHSLRFIDAPDSSHLSYCIIQYGRATGEIPDSHGGGIYCGNSNPVITYCTIIDNTAEMSGGGIGCEENSNPQIIHCILINNSSLAVSGEGGGGGGIACFNSNPIISNCTINGNTANYAGGGIAFSESDGLIEYCNIMGNTAYTGGGIACHSSNTTISYCLITDNTATTWDGGGIDAWSYADITVINCTVSGNDAGMYGGGIDCMNSDMTMVNTIIEGNTGSEGVYFYTPGNVDITYSDFCNNLVGDFGGSVPPGLGEITSTNANGDSCDTFINIFLDPLFVDPANGDYHLQLGSPCIDAGDPDPIYCDPDGTIADIGRFYFPQTGINDNTIVQTKDYLQQNYPNPLNPTTTINYQLPENSKIELTVYNLKGQKVKQLVSDQLSSGQHSVIWNGTDENNKPVSSGIYFYKLKTNNFEKTRKMILLK